MTSDQDGLLAPMTLRNGMCAAIFGATLLTTQALKAEDISEQRPASDDGTNSIEAVESGVNAPTNFPSGRPGTSIEQRRPTFDDLDAAASGLNDVLDGARSKLNQLREAADMAAIAAALRDELEASAEENNRLAAGLTKAQSVQRSLETSMEQANDQVGKLTKSLEETRSEASDLDQQLRKSREQIATTDASRAAAAERADRAEKQLADSRGQNQTLSQENKALKDRLQSARLERDDARRKTEATRQERDAAHQELDTIRVRIAGLLRSVLHADETVDASANQKNAVASALQTAPADKEPAGMIYEVTRTSNIRAEPDRRAERVAIGVAGDTVSVLRKIPDDNWFEVKTERGITGFIFGELIEPKS